MTRSQILRIRVLALLQCLALILDITGNLLLSMVLTVWAVVTRQEGEPASPHETMSARSGRAILSGKKLGSAFGWCIDKVFGLWQPPVAKLPDGREFVHPSHCVRAYVKTRHLCYLPHAYREPLPSSLDACYRISNLQE